MWKAAWKYWEPRRAIYNGVLTAVVACWLIFTWPHFRPALNFHLLVFGAFLALLANLCYSAAYAVEVPAQLLFRDKGLVLTRVRTGVWVAGTLFAVLLACYWIADEIYPYV